ncbi:Uncharacterised protein [Mycobacteroides abscessus subsp. abscessus]|nr:Uncharacterised protein [Mycobacteroides abscessus subsp. abscessus]
MRSFRPPRLSQSTKSSSRPVIRSRQAMVSLASEFSTVAVSSGPASSTPTSWKVSRIAATTAQRAGRISSCPNFCAHCVGVGPNQPTGCSSAAVAAPPGKPTLPSGESGEVR